MLFFFFYCFLLIFFLILLIKYYCKGVEINDECINAKRDTCLSNVSFSVSTILLKRLIPGYSINTYI